VEQLGLGIGNVFFSCTTRVPIVDIYTVLSTNTASSLLSPALAAHLMRVRLSMYLDRVRELGCA